MSSIGTDAQREEIGVSGPGELPGEATRSWLQVLSRWGVAIVLGLLIVGFGIAEPSTFLTWANAKSILSTEAVPAMVALAVILPLAAGEFDLSVGATLGFCSIFTAWATSNGMPVPLCLVAVIAIAALIGAFNAFLVGGIGLNALIATLATGSILSGGNLLITNGSTLFSGIPTSLTKIAQTHLLSLPLTVFYCLAIAVILWFLLEQTPYGRFMRATGLGREAARLSGVRTGRWLSESFIVAAIICGLAGFLQTATVSSAPPNIGPEYLLPAYAAAFLGAATIKPGLFNVWGTLIGVLLLAVGITGLTLMGAPFWVTGIFNGSALVISVTMSILLVRRIKGQGGGS